MSTFGGLMQEYQSISIDRFDGANLNSSVFMLSHNHKDHTVGLSSAEFLYKLKNNLELKLYCSPVTRDLLLLDDCFGRVSKSIVPLEIDSPSVIDIPDTKTGKVKKTVTITLLQAGHCPGSVMFLFEGDEGTVLYTGDFRLTKQDIASCLPLHSADGSVKELKSLYADTTFCVPRAFFIPKREDSIVATIDIVRDWISQSRAHIILLSYKANLGYENMFMRLSEEFQMKIHVHQSKYEEYKRINSLADYMTSDPSQTQIHACKWHLGRRTDSLLPCGFRLVDGYLPVEVCTVALSTMCFVQTVGLEAYSKRLSKNFFRVCYSFHSSYSEIRDMILYLRPDRVFPNVVPAYDDASAAQLQKRLNSFVKLAKKTHQSALHMNAGGFGLLKSPKGRKRQYSSQQLLSSGSLKLIFDEDEKNFSSSVPKVAKFDDHFESSRSDSKDLKLEIAQCEFPLLFGSQGCNGNSEGVTKSSPGLLEQGAENIQNYVQKSNDDRMDGDSLDLDRKRAIAADSEDSDIDPEMENTAAFVLEPGSLVSYISEDDSDGPMPPTTTASLPLTAPKSPPPSSTAPESSSPAIVPELSPPIISKSPLPITPESETWVSAKTDVDSRFPKTTAELSFPDEKVKVELKDAIDRANVEDSSYKVESGDVIPEECKIKTPSISPSCKPISNGLQTCVDISEETDSSDVIVVDDNSENEAADSVFVWLNESNSQIHSSRTLDSDITVDVGSSPYKRHQVPANVSLSDAPAVNCECIDLSSDDSSLHSASGFEKGHTVKSAARCDKVMVKGDHVAKNSEGDSLSDDYEGDDEFEETDKESGYDSDAEIINSRKCTYECVIKERALRFSRTAVNGSDVIVIDDDDINDAGTSYPRERRCFAPYSSTASSGSSSESSLSTSPENFLDNEPSCNDSAVPQNSNNRLIFLHRNNKPRLWPGQLPYNTDGIRLSSSEDLFSS